MCIRDSLATPQLQSIASTVPVRDDNGVTRSSLLLLSTVTDYRTHCRALLPAWDIIPDHRLNYETKHLPGLRFEPATFGSARPRRRRQASISPLGHLGRLDNMWCCGKSYCIKTVILTFVFLLSFVFIVLYCVCSMVHLMCSINYVCCSICRVAIFT